MLPVQLINNTNQQHIEQRRRYSSSSAASSSSSLSKRVYYCQRCLNHGCLMPRKNHKCDCPYAMCVCDKCILVEKRRMLNTKLHDLEEQQQQQQQQQSDVYTDQHLSDDNESYQRHSSNTLTTITHRTSATKGERVPKCQKCQCHGISRFLKGHKRLCPYRDCLCIKCRVVSERQRLMADQIKIRRRQRKSTNRSDIGSERAPSSDDDKSSSSPSNEEMIMMNVATAAAPNKLIETELLTMPIIPTPYLESINIWLYRLMQLQQLQQCQQSLAAAAVAASTISPSPIDPHSVSNISPSPMIAAVNHLAAYGTDGHQQFETFLAKVRRLEEVLRIDNNNTSCMV